MKKLVLILIVLVGFSYFQTLLEKQSREEEQRQRHREEQLRQWEQEEQRRSIFGQNRRNAQSFPELYEAETPEIIYSHVCVYCDGTGQVNTRIPVPPNFTGDPDHYSKYPDSIKQTCSHCGGSGMIYKYK